MVQGPEGILHTPENEEQIVVMKSDVTWAESVILLTDFGVT